MKNMFHFGQVLKRILLFISCSLSSKSVRRFCQNHIAKTKFRSSHPEDIAIKSCSENMQQIYRRTPMPKCNFNKVALLLH